jgi:murein DD-endopeptidase MepM/ murein hydrolase activator NlpD
LAAFETSVSSPTVADGTMVTATIKFKEPFSGKITGSFEDESSDFFLVPEIGPNVYQAFFGIPYGHKLGPADIKIKVGGKSGTLPFEIVDGKYPAETLKVDNSRVNPPKKVMSRIIRELHETGAVNSTVTPERYWKGPFQLPIDSKITSPFGGKRLYNGHLKNYHGGLDLRAPVGTPIHAAGAGVVLMAKNLYYSGNTIIIDHGYGLITMYFHMSKFRVKKGDTIAQGQLLGLSGKTGRVTGPHLHWQVIIHKIKVNPAALLEVGK